MRVDCSRPDGIGDDDGRAGEESRSRGRIKDSDPIERAPTVCFYIITERVRIIIIIIVIDLSLLWPECPRTEWENTRCKKIRNEIYVVELPARDRWRFRPPSNAFTNAFVQRSEFKDHSNAGARSAVS